MYFRAPKSLYSSGTYIFMENKEIKYLCKALMINQGFIILLLLNIKL